MARKPRQTRARPIRRTKPDAALVASIAAAKEQAEAQPQAEELTIERAQQIIDRQRAQVETCRRMFYRLAEVRAAELVQHQGKSWDDGANYINAEMQGLDAALNEFAL